MDCRLWGSSLDVRLLVFINGGLWTDGLWWMSATSSTERYHEDAYCWYYWEEDMDWEKFTVC